MTAPTARVRFQADPSLSRRYRYRHYGLTLEANQPLPRLTPGATGTPDITIELCEPDEVVHVDLPWVMPDPTRGLWLAHGAAGTHLRVRYNREEEWAEFVVDPEGTTISVSRAGTVPLAEAAELLLGPIFCCTLAQRGLTCLHASLIAVAGRVIALLGPSGTGKSTTSAALLQRGGILISDDLAVLSEVDGRPAVIPGAPRLRLTPDAAHALTGSFDSLAPVWVHEERRPAKRYLEAAECASDGSPRPLDCVYLLSPRRDELPEPSLRPLTPGQALAKLMTHRQMAAARGRADHQRDFEVLARLSEAVPARELLRPNRLSATEQTAALICSDAIRLG